MSMSGLVYVGGVKEGEFEADSPTEEVAAQIRLGGADAVQLRAQEIDEAAKTRIVVQRDPLGVYEVVRRPLRRAGRPVEIEPLGYDEDREHGGIAARFRRLVHDRLEAGGRLRIGIGRAPVLGDAERLERAEEIGVLFARHQPDEPAQEKPGLESVGGGERCAQQYQEAVEEAVVLDEIARHYDIEHGSSVQLLDKAMSHGLRPARLASSAQGFGEAFRHEV